MYNSPAANNKQTQQEALSFYQWFGDKIGGIRTKESSINPAQVEKTTSNMVWGEIVAFRQYKQHIGLRAPPHWNNGAAASCFEAAFLLLELQL